MGMWEDTLAAGAQKTGDLLMDIAEGLTALGAKTLGGVVAGAGNKLLDYAAGAGGVVAAAGETAKGAVTASVSTDKSSNAPVKEKLVEKSDLPMPPEALANAREAGINIRDAGKNGAGKKDVAIGEAQELGGEDLGKVAATTLSNGRVAAQNLGVA